MATKRRPVMRGWQVGITFEQELELQLDRDGGRSGGFATDEEAREAWFANRERLMGRSNPGTRPAGWWRFESPVPKPRHCSAAYLLYEHNLLEAAEREHLEARWRAHEAQCFEHADSARDYFAGCRSAGVPYSLRRAWRGATKADVAAGEFRDIDPRELLQRLA